MMLRSVIIGITMGTIVLPIPNCVVVFCTTGIDFLLELFLQPHIDATTSITSALTSGFRLSMVTVTLAYVMGAISEESMEALYTFFTLGGFLPGLYDTVVKGFSNLFAMLQAGMDYILALIYGDDVTTVGLVGTVCVKVGMIMRESLPRTMRRLMPSWCSCMGMCMTAEEKEEATDWFEEHTNELAAAGVIGAGAGVMALQTGGQRVRKLQDTNSKIVVHGQLIMQNLIAETLERHKKRDVWGVWSCPGNARNGVPSPQPASPVARNGVSSPQPASPVSQMQLMPQCLTQLTTVTPKATISSPLHGVLKPSSVVEISGKPEAGTGVTLLATLRKYQASPRGAENTRVTPSTSESGSKPKLVPVYMKPPQAGQHQPNMPHQQPHTPRLSTPRLPPSPQHPQQPSANTPASSPQQLAQSNPLLHFQQQQQQSPRWTHNSMPPRPPNLRQLSPAPGFAQYPPQLRQPRLLNWPPAIQPPSLQYNPGQPSHYTPSPPDPSHYPPQQLSLVGPSLQYSGSPVPYGQQPQTPGSVPM
jgi:hypothetical protein